MSRLCVDKYSEDTYDFASRPVFDDGPVPVAAVERPDLSTKSVSDCGVTAIVVLYTV